MESVDRLMKQALADQVFPGGVLLVSHNGQVTFHKAFGLADLRSKTPVTQETLFDLASLTKPLATTLAVARLVGLGAFGLQDPLADLVPDLDGTPLARVTVEHLLAHRSGLPDYRPFYVSLEQVPVRQRRKTLNRLLADTPAAYPTGTRCVYSDLGFMVLRWLVEQTAGRRLDHLVQQDIYQPLGLDDLFFVDLNQPVVARKFAATEACPWRKEVVQGAVHDENAFALGGVDGHAGLFGTASDVHDLLSEILELYHGRPSGGVLTSDVVHGFLGYDRPPHRALGFDRPSDQGSSSGQYFSKNSVGHLGFTGVSFWMDLDRDVVVVFLSNRIHPSRRNEKIKAFRPVLHDEVMRYLIRNSNESMR